MSVHIVGVHVVGVHVVSQVVLLMDMAMRGVREVCEACGNGVSAYVHIALTTYCLLLTADSNDY